MTINPSQRLLSCFLSASRGHLRGSPDFTSPTGSHCRQDNKRVVRRARSTAQLWTCLHDVDSYSSYLVWPFSYLMLWWRFPNCMCDRENLQWGSFSSCFQPSNGETSGCRWFHHWKNSTVFIPDVPKLVSLTLFQTKPQDKKKHHST